MINTCFIQAVNTFNFLNRGKLDNWVYFRGLAVNKIDPDIPYIIVTGFRGVGKSTYCEAMSKHNDVQYISVQSINLLYAIIRENKLKHIHITEVL